MASTTTLLRVFVASPSDVVEERRILEDVIDDFNRARGNNRDVRLELVKWETHTRPGFAEDAQDVINKQIGDDYEIFVGIMWGRFGSSTSRADSGTEEEFDRAYTRLKDRSLTTPIMFYFKNGAIPFDKIDPKQVAKVQSFRKRIGKEYGGLYHEFETPEEFRSKVLIHLSRLAQEMLKERSGTPSETETQTTQPAPGDTVNPLANLTALTDHDSDEGLIELSESANDAMENVAGAFANIGKATDDLGQRFQQRTAEINRITSAGSTPDLRAAKRVSSNSANDIDIFVTRLSAEIPVFHEQHALAMDAFGRVAMISDVDLEASPKDFKSALKSLKECRGANLECSNSMSELRGALSDLPRMTTAFARARRRAVAVMDDLLVQMGVAANQTQDIEELLERMIDPPDSGSQ